MNTSVESLGIEDNMVVVRGGIAVSQEEWEKEPLSVRARLQDLADALMIKLEHEAEQKGWKAKDV